jgi:hypothetical protein
MADAPARNLTPSEAVGAYKTMLAAIIDSRPSGTRQRLASALAKNRSFISQITNPAYPTPVPASHLDVIFDLCHFSPAQRREFASLYAVAHPRRAAMESRAQPVTMVPLPDLGDDERNRKLHGLVSGFVRQIARLIDETEPTGGNKRKGKRR